MITLLKIFYQGIPREAFSTSGRYHAGFGYPGTKRYCLYGMRPPRDVLVRERVVRFSVWHGSGILEFVQDAFVRAGDFASITGPRGFGLASTAVWCI